MGEGADQIEREINRTRDDLSENFYELEQKVKTTFDWRSQFEKRPGTMMAIAFTGGLLLSALLPSGHSRRAGKGRSYGPWSRNFSGESTSYSPKANRNGGSSPTFEAIKAAVLGVAANRLGGLAGDLLANLKQEFSKSRTRNAHEAGTAYPSYTAPSTSSAVAENI